MATNKQYSSAIDMARDLFVEDDTLFADELQAQIKSRRLVRCLASLRNKHGVNQEAVAKRLGCQQAKISKIENGTDAAVTVAEIEAYAKAIDCDVELIFRSRRSKLADEIKYHVGCLHACFQKLIGLAQGDRNVSSGVAKFHLEALGNLANIMKPSAQGIASQTEENRVQITSMIGDRCDGVGVQLTSNDQSDSEPLQTASFI